MAFDQTRGVGYAAFNNAQQPQKTTAELFFEWLRNNPASWYYINAMGTAQQFIAFARSKGYVMTLAQASAEIDNLLRQLNGTSKLPSTIPPAWMGTFGYQFKMFLGKLWSKIAVDRGLPDEANAATGIRG